MKRMLLLTSALLATTTGFAMSDDRRPAGGAGFTTTLYIPRENAAREAVAAGCWANAVMWSPPVPGRAPLWCWYPVNAYRLPPPEISLPPLAAGERCRSFL